MDDQENIHEEKVNKDHSSDNLTPGPAGHFEEYGLVPETKKKIMKENNEMIKTLQIASLTNNINAIKQQSKMLSTNLSTMAHNNIASTFDQSSINNLNFQLHSANFLLHFINANNSQTIQNNYHHIQDAVNRGSKIINQLIFKQNLQNQSLTTINGDLVKLTDEISTHRQEINFINQEISAQKNLLNGAIQHFDVRLNKSEKTILKHEKELQRINQITFKMDALIDSGLILISLLMSNNGIVSSVINFISRLISLLLSPFITFSPNIPSNSGLLKTNGALHEAKKKNIFIRFILRSFNIKFIFRLLLTVVLFIKIRNLFIFFGIHNHKGSLLQYATYIISKRFRSTYKDNNNHNNQVVEESDSDVDGAEMKIIPLDENENSKSNSSGSYRYGYGSGSGSFTQSFSRVLHYLTTVKPSAQRTKS